jgi:hypothetical protein
MLEKAHGPMILPAASVPFIGMHVGIFPLFIAFGIASKPWQTGSAFGWNSGRVNLRWKELRRFVPTWCHVGLYGLFAYALLNFLVVGFGFGDLPAWLEPAPDGPDARAARLFSGHWMVFYALPAAFFGYVPPDARPAAPPVA